MQAAGQSTTCCTTQASYETEFTQVSSGHRTINCVLIHLRKLKPTKENTGHRTINCVLYYLSRLWENHLVSKTINWLLSGLMMENRRRQRSGLSHVVAVDQVRFDGSADFGLLYIHFLATAETTRRLWKVTEACGTSGRQQKVKEDVRMSHYQMW